MRIKHAELLRAKLRQQPIFIEGQWEIEDETGFRLDAPITVKGTLLAEEDGYFFRGELITRLGGECVRCLKDVSLKFAVPVEARFQTNADDAQWEEGDIPVFSLEKNGDVNLPLAFQDAFSLSLPMKLLCDEMCSGLCPRCGQNLNEASCQCDIEPVDPRLAPLLKLKGMDGMNS